MVFSVIGFMDLLGTIAFAISGALVGVKRDMDIFGVNILAVITACGGGMTRDIVIGKEPPVMFVNPIYVLIAVITANIVFLYLYT
ncbi:trimeric intracellular cation channel family protein, partial [Stomatobaculum longum]